MPRTLGAKDKKKRRRRRLLNIALGVGGAAALGGLGLLALRKKPPIIGNTSRPVPSNSFTPNPTPRPGRGSSPQITPASSPPPRSPQPSNLPGIKEIQPSSIIPTKPSAPPRLISNRVEVQPVVAQPKTIKALPPGKTPPPPKALPPGKPEPIPAKTEVKPDSIVKERSPIKRSKKKKPEVKVTQDTQPAKTRRKKTPRVVKGKYKVVKPKKRIQEQKSFIKRAALWSRRNNAAAMERKKNIARLLIRKATDEQGRKVAKAVLKRSPKLAGAAARIGVNATKSVKLTRRQLLQATGASAVVQGKKAAGEAIAQANPITKVNKAFNDIKQAGIEADKAADLLEKEGNKIITRREMLRRARQYAFDYARARPGRTVKPLVGGAYNNLKNLADPVGLAKDLAKPENMGRLAQWIERFGGATGLYSDNKELIEFNDPD
jgi:hypothetical protein